MNIYYVCRPDSCSLSRYSRGTERVCQLNWRGERSRSAWWRLRVLSKGHRLEQTGLNKKGMPRQAFRTNLIGSTVEIVILW